MSRFVLPPLYPIVDPGPPEADPATPGGRRPRPGREPERLAAAILAGGAKILQLRMKGGAGGWGAGAVLAAAKQLRRLTRDAGALFIVNDRADVALIADADGVHVGQEDLPYEEVRRLLGPGRLIGVSTHSVEEARAAEAAGADYIGFGPMFPTATKRDTRPVQTLERLQAVRAAVALPIAAIGGITAERIAAVRAAGADSVAVISAICDAADPTAATRRLRQLAGG
ncbi:MAG TPA: thiamine phosphate synthase [Thermodesulfobacteriota bacterium]|nr:thiamine phosphate synthase [Thermodesulfobacteriota bacterium]